MSDAGVSPSSGDEVRPSRRLEAFAQMRLLLPAIRETRKRMIKTTNRTLAIHAAVPAMPPNPKTPAMSATIRKVIAQPNIAVPPSVFDIIQTWRRLGRNGLEPVFRCLWASIRAYGHYPPLVTNPASAPPGRYSGDAFIGRTFATDWMETDGSLQTWALIPNTLTSFASARFASARTDRTKSLRFRRGDHGCGCPAH